MKAVSKRGQLLQRPECKEAAGQTPGFHDNQRTCFASYDIRFAPFLYDDT